MALTDDQKRKIEEEEAYRAELKSEPKKKKGIGCLGIILSLLGVGLLFSVIIVAINPSDQIEKAVQTQQDNSPAVRTVFDVPALVDKNLDQVIKILGTPQGQDPTTLQIQQGVDQWEKSFKKDGQEILVTYTISNKKVVDFFISTDDPSGKTKDTKRLLGLGNLKTNDPRYKIEFVKTIKDPSSYTGVKVTPN